MKTAKIVLIAAVMSAFAASAASVENGRYLTGAWGYPSTPEWRELYLKGGLNLVGYNANLAEWAKEHDMSFIGNVSGRPPQNAARPFEAANGMLFNSVGLFTHVNFNAPTVEEWWNSHVPKRAAAMPGAERIRFWKIHNEFGYHSSDIFDYSEGSISKYRQWLAGRYADIAELNRKWHSSYADFAGIEAPRNELAEQLPNWLEWRRFTAWNFARYFRESGDLIRSVVPGAAVSDNFYITTGLDGWDLYELSRQTDYLALDLYAIGRWHNLLPSLDRGRCAAAAWNKPFVMMEYHAGPNHWITKVHKRDLFIEANVALARECRALMWYMWKPGTQGREEGIHGMLDMAGKPTERYTAVAKISAFTERLAPVLARTRSAADVAIVLSNDSQYFAHATGGSVWSALGAPAHLARLLDGAGISFTFINLDQLRDNVIGDYQAVILPGLPIVSDRGYQLLQDYAATGGTVIRHPGSALRNEFGHITRDEPFAATNADTDKDAIWEVRQWREQGKTGHIHRESLGKGQLLFCAVDCAKLQGIVTKAERLAAASLAYGAILRDHAGITAALQLSAKDFLPGQMDARLLQDGKLNVLAITNLASEDNDEPVTVTLGQLGQSGPTQTALYLRPESADIQRLTGRATAAGLSFTLPAPKPAGMLLFGEWQPIVGIRMPEVLHPGDVTEATVSIDNLAAVPVSGQVRVQLPTGWALGQLGNNDFSNLASGARVELRFRINVPQDVATDFFAIDYPVIAQVRFTAGMDGILSAKSLPFVKPMLDVRMVYQDRILNPWQEFTPPILRWGWNNEVVTPPPPPVAVRGNTAVTLQLSVAPLLAGRTLDLSVSDEQGRQGQVRPAEGHSAVLKAGESELPVIITLPGSGDYTLRAQAGGTDATTTLVFPAAVGTETVEAALAVAKPQAPAGFTPRALLGVGARGASPGTPVTVPLTLPERLAAEQLALFAVDGRPLRYTLFADTISFNADVADDGVAIYTLATADANKALPTAAPRLFTELGQDGRANFQGDSYRITFNTIFGWIESMALRNEQGEFIPFMPERSGPVLLTDSGVEIGPEHAQQVTLLSYQASATNATLELERTISNGGTGISVRELWTFNPNHLKADVFFTNRSNQPLRFRKIVYELGCNMDTASQWLTEMNGHQRRDALPASITTSKGMMVDLLTGKGSGMAVTLRRCAQNKTWASISNQVSHSVTRTRINLTNAVSIDPKDFILAEFDLWPHSGPSAVPATPVFSSASRILE